MSGGGARAVLLPYTTMPSTPSCYIPVLYLPHLYATTSRFVILSLA